MLFDILIGMRGFYSKKPVLILLLIIAASGILFYKLDQQYLWTDEVFSFHAAERIIETGETSYESGLEYPRAPLYHKLLASSMEIFGKDEFGSRILNIPFALATALLCFFFVSDIKRKEKNKYAYATAAAFLLIFSNFTLAQVRETRMYLMETFVLTASIFSFVKAFLNDKNLFRIDLKEFKPLWAILSAALFLLAFNTHEIAAIFALSAFIFLIMLALLTKKRDTIWIVLIITITGIVFTYLRFGTLNVYTIFNSFSPYWGTKANILYFPVLLARNFPGIFLLSPIILWTVYKLKDSRQSFLLTVFVTYTIFLSLQTAQSERYITPIIPVLLVLTILTISDVIERINRNSFYYKLIVCLISLGLIGHSYLFIKELNEIDSYTNTSISIHKKFQFNKVEEYMNTLKLKEYIVLADEHSAYTLYEKGFKIDYILMPNKEKIESKKEVGGKDTDIYFNIELLAYRESFKQFQVRVDKPYIVIIRDYENFPGLAQGLKEIKGFNRPRVYTSKP